MSIQQNKPFQKFHDGKKGFNKFNKFNKFKKPNYKKRHFLENAKGFAKKGNFGRGAHIEEEDFTYFMGIFITQQKNVQTLLENISMANNVMVQTVDKEVHLASNQIVSKVLENSLGYVDAEHLERFFKVFFEDFRTVCSNVHASHVFQKILETAFVRSVGKTVIETEVIEVEVEERKTKKPRIDIVTDLKYNMTQEFSEAHRTKCSEFVVRVGKFLLNNLEDYVSDTYATHLIRSAILTLAGVYVPKGFRPGAKIAENPDRFSGLKHYHRLGKFNLSKTVFKVPDEWLEIMKEFPERLQMWPQFKDMPYNNSSSSLLQVICIAFNATDKKALDKFIQNLIVNTFMDVKIPKKIAQNNQTFKKENEEANGKESDDEEDEKEEISLKKEIEEEDKNDENEEEEDDDEEEDENKPSVFKSDPAVRLLQTTIAVASEKVFSKIYELFADRLLSLANKDFTWHAVQSIVNYVVDKSLFEKIFEELSPHFEKFIENRKTTILSAVSATCLRLQTKQAAFVTAMHDTLHCKASLGENRPKAFFSCLLKMKPFETLPYDTRKIVLMSGSLIIQDILQFNKPILMVNSILEAPVKDLMVVCESPLGSYIIDAFLSSTTIGEKSREKLIKHFEGFYMDLVNSKSGSVTLEKFVKAAGDGQKVAIAKELIGKENKLKGSFFGRILYNSLRLETFKLSEEQWKRSWNPTEVSKPVKVKNNKKKRPAS